MAKPIVTKRGKTWSYRFDAGTIAGKRCRPSKGGFRTKAEAEAAGTKAMAKFFGTGILFTPSEVNFGDFLTNWANTCARTKWKEKSYLTKQVLIRNKIMPYFGTYRVAAITSLLLQDFIDSMIAEGYAKNTVVSIKNILNGAFTYATVHGLISSNPMYSVKILYNQENRKQCKVKIEHTYIPPTTIDEILNLYPKYSSKRIALLIGYHTGARIGEICGLRWECIDLQNKKLTINKQLQHNWQTHKIYLTNPKYNSVRTIDIDDILCAELQAYRDQQNAHKLIYGEYYSRYSLYGKDEVIKTYAPDEEVDFVIRDENGDMETPSRLMSASARIKRQTNCKNFNFHSLRATHTSELLAKHLPLKYVQLRLGHKDVSVTLQIYQKMTAELGEEGREQLQNVFAMPDNLCPSENFGHKMDTKTAAI